jgi:hypothetical protein
MEQKDLHYGWWAREQNVIVLFSFYFVFLLSLSVILEKAVQFSFVPIVPIIFEEGLHINIKGPGLRLLFCKGNKQAGVKSYGCSQF